MSLWSPMMAPQGPNSHRTLLSPKSVIQAPPHRNITVVAPPRPLNHVEFAEKRFHNPNFVSDSHLRLKQPIDSTMHYNVKNSSTIIEIIKEKCPEIIPKIDTANCKSEEQTVSKQPEDLLKEYQNTNISVSEPKKMCMDHKGPWKDNHNRRGRQKHTDKSKVRLRMGKKSRQNIMRKEMCDMTLDDSMQDLSNGSVESPNITEAHPLILEDFIIEELTPLTERSDNRSITSESMPPVINKNQSGNTVFDPGDENAEDDKSMDMPLENSISPVNRRSRFPSICDSEDSFIVFEGDSSNVDDNSSEISSELSVSPRIRTRRIPSICESEDSFIMFDRDGVEDMEDDSCFSVSDAESSFDGRDETEISTDGVDCLRVDNKKVRFASEDKLREVHPMIKWSYAYQAARKGPWEMYARDRCRFKERIFRVERDIKHIFDPKHREKIYRERFENF